MKLFRRPPLLPVALACAVAACLSIAADTPQDPLKKMRGDWRALVEKDTRTLREQYAANLLTLERELAARGDYAGAARAKKERLKVHSAPAAPEKTAPSEVASPEPGQPLVLEPATASLSGSVSHDKEAGVLTNWKEQGAAARWLLPSGLQPGGYEVELTWSCPPDSGGSFVLREDRYRLNRPVKPTSSWDVYQTEIIGTLRVIANSRLLELSAAAVKGSGLLQLKSIRLLPVALPR